MPQETLEELRQVPRELRDEDYWRRYRLAYHREHKEYYIEYRQRPDVKEHLREQALEYTRRPEVKERASEYRQRPEVKEHRSEYSREYYRRPGVKERIVGQQIRKLMDKYQIDEEEAKLVRGLRITLGCQIPESVIEIEREMIPEEGLAFTEMVMDGIPERMRRKIEELKGER